MQHQNVDVRDAKLHVARLGNGPPLLFLHGWPEFWWTWEPVMTRLADRFSCIAPDLRGFGDSDKPRGPFGPADHADDMIALLDALAIDKAGIIGHDVGGAVMQPLGRKAPARLAGLLFFNFVYPGIGPRMGTPDRLKVIWYQSFHQMEMAPQLVGATRDSCRAYLGHILREWAHRQEIVEEMLEPLVDTYMKPGNLEGGFAHYKAANAGRIAMMRGEAPHLPPITVPTCVRWTTHDSLFDYAWTDKLGETFADLDLAPFEGVGHFPHREDPDRTAREIATFFDRMYARR